MDWDVRLKSQLKLIALGALHLQCPATRMAPAIGSPYGNDWDVLWLGHCGEVFPEQLEEYSSKPPTDLDLLSVSRKYTISPDSTVSPLAKNTLAASSVHALGSYFWRSYLQLRLCFEFAGTSMFDILMGPCSLLLRGWSL